LTSNPNQPQPPRSPAFPIRLMVFNFVLLAIFILSIATVVATFFAPADILLRLVAAIIAFLALWVILRFDIV
jgi:hypothetical protein